MKNTLARQNWARRLAADSVNWARDNVPRSIQQRVPARLRQVARRILQSGKTRAQALDDKLWGGHSQTALKDLQALACDETVAAVHRSAACYSLARWEAVNRNYEAALGELRRGGEIAPWRGKFKRHYLLEALFLCHLGQTSEARDLIVTADEGGFDTSVELLLANTWNAAFAPQADHDADARALDHINTVYRHFGLCELRKRDDGKPLSMENVEGTGVAPVEDPARAVTVIVPVYNAQDTIETALRGLAQQSWRALSVIVVDDCSSDRTCDLVKAFCRSDSRFRLIRKQENSGSYGSRNLALQEVTTLYVTVHDGDDWSHPQKIERQMQHLAATGAPYNYTMWVRTTPRLGFVSDARPYHRLLSPDHSAGLFLTESVRAAGGWDQARISADTELFWRLEALNGTTREHSRGRRVMVECPLAFGRHLDTSLTQAGATHALTMFHGVRREYREAADFWHRSLRSLDDAVAPFFPAPGLIRPGRAKAPAHDLFLIADFNAVNSSAESALAGAYAAADASLSVAVMHYPSYHRDVTRPLRHDLRRAALEKGIRVVAPGEHVQARLCVLQEVGLFQHALDRFPVLEAEKSVVVVNRLPQAEGSNPFAWYEPEATAGTAERFFSQMPEFAPIAPLARTWIEENGLFPRAGAIDWYGLFKSGLEGAESAQWRGGQRRNPVLGSLGSNDPSAWLDDSEAMREAYCAGRPCETRFMAGTDFARDRLTRMPRNWRDLTATGTGSSEFLSQLDVFVYFPGPEHSDALGYPIALAMDAGLPVIASPHFAVNFGDAAIYAKPGDVWPAVQELWMDRDKWQRYSDAGRLFAQTYFGKQAYLDRLCYYGLDQKRLVL